MVLSDHSSSTKVFRRSRGSILMTWHADRKKLKEDDPNPDPEKVDMLRHPQMVANGLHWTSSTQISGKNQGTSGLVLVQMESIRLTARAAHTVHGPCGYACTTFLPGSA